MMRWNLQSNACDVLGLGPRTAGQLATVGIRSVAELLAAKPQAIAPRLREKSLTAEVVAAWQGEASLILALPELPAGAARLLAAAEMGGTTRIQHCTPTELLSLLESAQQQSPISWLAEMELPTVAEVSAWISLAQSELSSEKSFAA